MQCKVRVWALKSFNCSGSIFLWEVTYMNIDAQFKNNPNKQKVKAKIRSPMYNRPPPPPHSWHHSIPYVIIKCGYETPPLSPPAWHGWPDLPDRKSSDLHERMVGPDLHEWLVISSRFFPSLSIAVICVYWLDFLEIKLDGLQNLWNFFFVFFF